MLDAVAGRGVDAVRDARGVNLLRVGPGHAEVLSWDGAEVRETVLGPGIHMVAHDDVDDPRTARIAHWLPEFAAHPARGERWWTDWLAIVDASSGLPATDDRALVRDNRPWGVPTLSLLYCVAEIGPETFDVRSATLAEPGAWDAPDPLPLTE